MGDLKVQTGSWRKWQPQAVAAAIPLVGIASIGAAASVAFGGWLGLGLDVVVPHVATLLSASAVLYALVAMLPRLGIPEALARTLVGVVSVAFGFALVVFYVATFASFMFFKELPTRQLIKGYLGDLAALLQALPLTGTALVLLLSIVGLSGLALGLGLAYAMDKGRTCIRKCFEFKTMGIVFRIAAYGSATHLLMAFSVPLDWHVARHEPILSSWHDVRLANPVVSRQRNPVQTAIDARVEAAYPRGVIKRASNVILVYVDALRADVVQPYGGPRRNMPFVTSLVESGELKQVGMALAACPSTICGIGAILQSRPTWLQSPDNFSLPRVLASQGYRNVYVLASNHQDFFDLKDYYRPIDFYIDGKDLSPTRHGNDYLVLDGLDRLGVWDGRPTFLMIGLISPHVGGIRSPQNRLYLPDRFSFVGDPEQFVVAYRNNYDNGVVQADDVLRQIWKKLGDYGYLSDAIVVITADHGESLGEHGMVGHLRSLNQPELRIPLWIRDHRGLEPPAFARQIDIAPTILEALGLPIPATWHGRSIYAAEPVKWSVHYVHDFRDKISVVRHEPSSTLKYDFDRATGEERVYDLVRDPLAATDVLGSVPDDILGELRAEAKRAFLGH